MKKNADKNKITSLFLSIGRKNGLLLRQLTSCKHNANSSMLKIAITSFIVFLFGLHTISAQDVIIRDDGSEILCKVEEIGIDFVKYKIDSEDGPSVTLPSDGLLMIEFPSGKRHIFNRGANSLKLGQKHQGGVIVYLDESGKHGVLAATEDQTTSKVMWGPDGNTGALSSSNGQQNTEDILMFFAFNEKKLKMTAAYTCDRLKLNGYSDWYLPAIDELMYLYRVRDKVPNLKLGDYTSSTEMRRADAYSIHFRPHRRSVFYYNKDNRDYYVRCFRKF